jgi:hypothetical protein
MAFLTPEKRISEATKGDDYNNKKLKDKVAELYRHLTVYIEMRKAYVCISRDEQSIYYNMQRLLEQQEAQG